MSPAAKSAHPAVGWFVSEMSVPPRPEKNPASAIVSEARVGARICQPYQRLGEGLGTSGVEAGGGSCGASWAQAAPGAQAMPRLEATSRARRRGVIMTRADRRKYEALVSVGDRTWAAAPAAGGASA